MWRLRPQCSMHSHTHNQISSGCQGEFRFLANPALTMVFSGIKSIKCRNQEYNLSPFFSQLGLVVEAWTSNQHTHYTVKLNTHSNFRLYNISVSVWNICKYFKRKHCSKHWCIMVVNHQVRWKCQSIVNCTTSFFFFFFRCLCIGQGWQSAPSDWQSLIVYA